MYFKHTDKTATIMKNGIPRCIGLALVAGGLAPMAAHAFLDERTPAPPPPAPVAQVAPAVIAPTLIAPVAPPAAPAAPAATASVTGDFTNTAWASAYPGPFGSMPLADALIAQVVPVVGGAIELDGPPELLTRQVVVPTGATRRATLQAVADGHALSINITGNKVTLASNQSSVLPVSQAGAVATVVAAGAQAQPDLPPPEPVMSWQIPKGTMLSTAMLEWANKWGWELIWKADVDYRIAADISMNETFLNGVGKVLEAYRAGNRPLWGDWNDDQKVLVIREPNNRDN